MGHRRGAALILVILALALGGSGCGGSSAHKPSAKAEAAAEAHWRSGLLHWRLAMQNALNGISIILATDGSMGHLKDSGSRTSARLDSLTATLERCTSVVQGLGRAPEPFTLSHHLALIACKTLHQADALVATAVVNIRSGKGVNSLNPVPGAGDLFSTGQNQLTTATRALRPSYA